MEEVKRDCRHYRGDRPCDFHKEEGVKCAACPHYDAPGEKILIVKLDALGDVLRTTSILPGLKKSHPDAEIVWITRANALPFFRGNPFVDRVLPLEPDGLAALAAERFDWAINLDNSRLSAGLLVMARAERKTGFDLDEQGRVRPLSEPAADLLRMSVFDDIKKANRRTYQEIVHGIVGLDLPPGEIVLNLSPPERDFAFRFSLRHGLDDSRLTVGLNTGGGGRWRHKRWTEEGTVELARRLRRELDAQVLLYGGPEEQERNRRILKAVPEGVIDTGCRNTLREFFALLSLSDILVTSDSMALHAALGLGKKVAALFGPTSPWEIELYGRGRRVTAPVPCWCCYRTDCSVTPTCMESITPDAVLDSVVALI